MSVCFAIVATVCLHDARVIEFKKTNLATNAAVEFADGGSADIVVESDDRRPFDKARMAKICDGEVCLAYYKHCISGKDSYGCLYAAVEVTGETGGEFSVWAPNNAKFRAVEQSIGIVARSLEFEAEFPLSALTRTTLYSAPPRCGEAKARC